MTVIPLDSPILAEHAVEIRVAKKTMNVTRMNERFERIERLVAARRSAA